MVIRSKKPEFFEVQIYCTLCNGKDLMVTMRLCVCKAMFFDDTPAEIGIVPAVVVFAIAPLIFTIIKRTFGI